MNNDQFQFIQHDAFDLNIVEEKISNFNEIKQFDWLLWDVICYPNDLLPILKHYLASNIIFFFLKKINSKLINFFSKLLYR